MSPFTALASALGIAVAASTITTAAIHGPLRRQLAASCPVDSTASYWMRSAVTLIYLLPMFVVLVFGLPDLRFNDLGLAEIARRALASAAFALAAIVSGMGLRLASLRPASKFDYPVR
jgi:hypothetical protein